MSPLQTCPQGSIKASGDRSRPPEEFPDSLRLSCGCVWRHAGSYSLTLTSILPEVWGDSTLLISGCCYRTHRGVAPYALATQPSSPTPSSPCRYAGMSTPTPRLASGYLTPEPVTSLCQCPASPDAKPVPECGNSWYSLLLPAGGGLHCHPKWEIAVAMPSGRPINPPGFSLDGAGTNGGLRRLPRVGVADSHGPSWGSWA